MVSSLLITSRSHVFFSYHYQIKTLPLYYHYQVKKPSLLFMLQSSPSKSQKIRNSFIYFYLSKKSRLGRRKCRSTTQARNQPSDDGGSFFLNCGPSLSPPFPSLPIPSPFTSLSLSPSPFLPSLLPSLLPFPFPFPSPPGGTQPLA